MKSHSLRDTDKPIRFITYNIFCLPQPCKCLHSSPNLSRAKKIAEKLLANKYDVIAIQEAWDPLVADYLQEIMDENGYECIRGVNGDACVPFKFVTSGLMLFSRLPIVDVQTRYFAKNAFGEESIGCKGFQAVKIQINKSEFITFYNQHLHADGCLFPRLSKWWGGSFSERRDRQMKLIREHMESWGHLPPQINPLLNYLVRFMAGDFNVPLNDERRMLSIKMVSETEQLTKRPNQYKLFSQFELNTPENFVESREAPRSKPGVKKELLPEFKTKDSQFETQYKGKYFGTYKDKEIKPLGAKNILDGIFVSHDRERKFGQLRTKIISFERDNDELSDHLPVEAVYDPNKKFIPKKRQFK